MKKIIIVMLVLIRMSVFAQQAPRNIIIITLDGYRWEELFKGADSSLLFAKTYFGQDSASKAKKYWAADSITRREMLMPFFWNTIAKQGQLYGNRDYNNYANVKNIHWNSFPGYNEIFTGYPDSTTTNGSPPNPNISILEYANQQPAYKNKVAIFASWEEYYRIFNIGRSKLPVNAGWTNMEGKNLTAVQQSLNEEQQYLPRVFGNNERMDAVTYAFASEYIKQDHPKVLYIAFIETDAYGHKGQYDFYLDAAHNIDAMIADLWQMVQSDPFYTNNTDLFITTDHGRGLGKDWTNHYFNIPHSNETWMAVMGPCVKPLGEIKTAKQIYQQQYAKTIAALLGIEFIGTHPAADPVKTVITF